MVILFPVISNHIAGSRANQQARAGAVRLGPIAAVPKRRRIRASSLYSFGSDTFTGFYPASSSIESNNLAVDDRRIRHGGKGLHDGGTAEGEVVIIARAKLYYAAAPDGLGAIAV